MANFPPSHEPPRYLDTDFNLLLPGTYVLRRGNGQRHHPLLRAGLIWKVQNAASNAIELAALNHPEQTVSLSQEVAEAVVVVHLSMYFSFDAYQAHYLKMEEAGWYLWVEDKDFPKRVVIKGYNPAMEIHARNEVAIKDLPLYREYVALEQFYDVVQKGCPNGLPAEAFVQDESSLLG